VVEAVGYKYSSDVESPDVQDLRPWQLLVFAAAGQVRSLGRHDVRCGRRVAAADTGEAAVS